MRITLPLAFIVLFTAITAAATTAQAQDWVRTAQAQDWVRTAQAQDWVRTAYPLAPKGSIGRQNRLADRYRLTRLRDRAQLQRFIRHKLLERVEDGLDYRICRRHVGRHDQQHADLYRYARPWTIDFLDTVLRTVNLGLNRPHVFRITSLVRTEEYQRRLRQRNRHAARLSRPERRSPHLTGAAVDISLLGVPVEARRLLVSDLQRLAADGAIDFIHERGNNCLHVFVVPDWREKSPLYPDVGC